MSKLLLNKESVRVLVSSDLQAVNGGRGGKMSSAWEANRGGGKVSSVKPNNHKVSSVKPNNIKMSSAWEATMTKGR